MTFDKAGTGSLPARPLCLYGYALEEAIRAILSVNPKKLKKLEEKPPEEKPQEGERAVRIKRQH